MAMFKALFFSILGLLSYSGIAQVSNPRLSDPQLKQVLKGNYNPQNFAQGSTAQPDIIACNLVNTVHPDSLWLRLKELTSFDTRHTYSDTVSANFGIGAARRWVYSYFAGLSSRRQNRLLPGYLDFDIDASNTCGALPATRNVLAVLPGRDPSAGSVLIQAHMDSRCAGPCDSICSAPGADDNASGTALVMELARTMSRYDYRRTLIFMLTTGEEQGLLGATAFSEYRNTEQIDLHAVLNNDIVGGTICGATASPPGCSPAGAIDSTHLRLYSIPVSRSFPHQGLARTVATLYREKIAPAVRVPMNLELIDQADRGGRGGDHLAFRNGTRAIRFSSAHEHGNGNPSGTPGYQDHQHTGDDRLGEDTDGDNLLDSFYVDRNYLARNAVINATSATWLAQGPQAPQFRLDHTANGPQVTITGDTSGPFRLAVSNFSGGAEYDALYRFQKASFLVPGVQSGNAYLVSVARLDSQQVMGPFSADERLIPSLSTSAAPQDSLELSIPCAALGQAERLEGASLDQGLQLLPMSPNPAREKATFHVLSNHRKDNLKGTLRLIDLQGHLLWERSVSLRYGQNQWEYIPKNSGLKFLQLWHRGELVGAQKVIFH